MNRCPAEERLSGFLDGELPEKEAMAIEAHCRSCSRCADELAAARGAKDLAAALEAPQVSAAEWDAGWAAVASRIAASRARTQPAGLRGLLLRHRRVWMPALAAAASVAIAVGVWVLSPGASPPQALRGDAVVIDSVESGDGYDLSVFQEGDVTIITLLPESPEEAPPHDASPKRL